MLLVVGTGNFNSARKKAGINGQLDMVERLAPDLDQAATRSSAFCCLHVRRASGQLLCLGWHPFLCRLITKRFEIGGICPTRDRESHIAPGGEWVGHYVFRGVMVIAGDSKMSPAGCTSAQVWESSLVSTRTFSLKLCSGVLIRRRLCSCVTFEIEGGLHAAARHKCFVHDGGGRLHCWRAPARCHDYEGSFGVVAQNA